MPCVCAEDGGGALSDTGKPVVDMTKLEYVVTWAVALAVGLALARFFLVNPILDVLTK